MDTNTRKIVDFAYNDDGVNFRDALYASIHDRVSAHIESKKQEIARSIIGQNEEVENVEEGYDSSGAYEKHDPKHPDFAKNYKKYKADNPQGQLGDFVAHMKKQK